MNKLILAVAVFLVIGGLIIKYDVEKRGGEFTTQYFGWLKQLGGNVQSATAHAVTDYTWLPAVGENTSTSTEKSVSESQP